MVAAQRRRNQRRSSRAPLDVAKALIAGGFEDVGEAVFNLLKHRVAGDYLHTSAIFNEKWEINSAVNNLNDYAGPKTGYQISEEKWDRLKTIRQAISPENV